MMYKLCISLNIFLKHKADSRFENNMRETHLMLHIKVLLCASYSSEKLVSLLKTHVCVGHDWLRLWFMNSQREQKNGLVCVPIPRNCFMKALEEPAVRPPIFGRIDNLSLKHYFVRIIHNIRMSEDKHLSSHTSCILWIKL